MAEEVKDGKFVNQERARAKWDKLSPEERQQLLDSPFGYLYKDFTVGNKETGVAGTIGSTAIKKRKEIQGLFSKFEATAPGQLTEKGVRTLLGDYEKELLRGRQESELSEQELENLNKGRSIARQFQARINTAQNQGSQTRISGRSLLG